MLAEFIELDTLIGVHIHSTNDSDHLSVFCLISILPTKLQDRLISQEVVFVHVDCVESILVGPIEAVHKFSFQIFDLQMVLQFSFDEKS